MKKLLIITGAGASLNFGLPSVTQIDQLMTDWALKSFPLVSDSTESLYTWVKKRMLDLYLQNNNFKKDSLNFEDIIFTIQNLSSIAENAYTKSKNSILNPFIEVKDFPEIVSWKTTKVADKNDFQFLQSILTDKLLEYMRVQCLIMQKEKTKELAILQKFFMELQKDFNLGIVNLNYDNVILNCLPDVNTGFDKITGKFDRKNLYEEPWNFCFHLHGSVHFDMTGGEDRTEMHKINWNKDLSSNFVTNTSGRNSNTTREGLQHLNSSIIVGLDKANQLLREPFASYYMQLDRLVYEADSILFIGYGFNDVHLNAIFPFIRYDKTKTRKVVVIDYAENSQDGLSGRHDDWTFGLLNTLPTNTYDMGDGTRKIFDYVSYYKQKKIVEKCNDSQYPIAIWYNGLAEACISQKKIIMELI